MLDRTKVVIAIAAGLVSGLAVTLAGHGEFGLLVGWDVATLVYLVRAWMVIWPLDAEETA